MNPISDQLYYNQRFIISPPVPKPIAWRISKVEHIHPTNINKLTLYQDKFDPHTDKLIDGFWYADYSKSAIEPTEPEQEETKEIYSKITTTRNSLVVDGGYRTLAVNFYEKVNGILTEVEHTPTWSFSVNGEDISPYIEQIFDGNKLKTKFIRTDDYNPDDLLGEIITVTVCDENGENSSSISLEVKGL